MKTNIINLGGYGGCELTNVIKRFDQPRYPFDWNVTTQNFVIECILSEGQYYFTFDKDDLVFEKNILLTENNDAFLCHDFTDWNAQKENVILKYRRKLDRLLSSIKSSDDIIFCRHLIDMDPYNNYSYCRIPFTRKYDEISRWEYFMNEISKKRNGKTKLVLFTNNSLLNTTFDNIFICCNDHRDPNLIPQWRDNCYNYILNLL